MGSVRGGPRRPNTTAYFVALAGILLLLVLLLCYFFYFCVSKVKELTREDSPLNQPCTNTARQRTSYPVQQGVRDSATAMARICRQIPATAGSHTVHPAASSPAPRDPSPLSPDTTDTTTMESTADPVTISTNDGSLGPTKHTHCVANSLSDANSVDPVSSSTDDGLIGTVPDKLPGKPAVCSSDVIAAS